MDEVSGILKETSLKGPGPARADHPAAEVARTVSSRRCFPRQAAPPFLNARSFDGRFAMQLEVVNIIEQLGVTCVMVTQD